MCPDRMIVTVVKVYLQLFCIKQKNTCFQTQLQKQQPPPPSAAIRPNDTLNITYTVLWFDSRFPPDRRY